MKNNIQYVLLTAPARHGKDTFFRLLDELYPNKFASFAYAFQLKEDLKPLIWNEFAIDTHNPTDKQKELIRPIFIAYGETWKKVNDLHWVEITDDKIQEQREYSNFIAVITDNRYAGEINYFKNKYPNQCVVVKIRRIGGQEPTNAEKISLPLIEPLVDYTIEWPNVDDVEELKPFVHNFVKKYFNFDKKD